MKAKLAVGVGLLAACSGGSGQSSEQARAERARAQATEAAGDVAGGETSEFSGDFAACPEIASSESLDLDDPEVASWVAMAQGHHEQTLGWRRLVLSNEVGGFAEHTSVSIDVNVLRGRDIVYGSGGSSADDEVSGCDGLRGRQIELEITLTTADGAVAITFRNWFEPAPTDARGIVLRHHGFNPDVPGAIDLNGTLELRPDDPALAGAPLIGVELEFSADSVRGSLSPGLGGSSSWSPIEAIFPDDACGSEGRSIGLDEFSRDLGGTPRAYYQRIATARVSERLGAVWKSSPSNVEPSPLDLPLEVPPPTEVSLDFGEPALACAIGTSVKVYAPVTVTTADGIVSFRQPFAFTLYDSGAYINERTPWVPAADFNEHMGLGGVNLESGYGSIYLQTNVDWRNAWVKGSLEVSQWDVFTDRRAAYPVLEWCSGQCFAGAEHAQTSPSSSRSSRPRIRGRGYP
jgi:hypothetical protein